MSARGSAWGAGVLVVMATVTGALTNELHGGWYWWVADAVATLAAATLAIRLAGASPGRRPAQDPGPVYVGPGGVHAGRDITGTVRTRVRLTGGDSGARHEPPRPARWRRWIGPGGVSADGGISGDVTTDAGDAPSPSA
ncbi:hypothetical protein [Actinoplanes sp. NPDC049118]|uniref:hypothetical protein n=1 Tax=Actinoplanes sp. NPDC049118 TaxID=3155769 RepID=UPI0034035F43